jgi:hypothetical protein
VTESAQIHPYEQSGTEQPRDVTTGEVEADVNTSKISNDLKMYNPNFSIEEPGHCMILRVDFGDLPKLKTYSVYTCVHHARTN